MTARRISDIVIALMRAKKAGAKLVGKSALERELTAWINEPEIPLTVNLEPRTAEPRPAVPYEYEMLNQLAPLACRQHHGIWQGDPCRKCAHHAEMMNNPKIRAGLQYSGTPWIAVLGEPV
jgi:hypothetical protein